MKAISFTRIMSFVTTLFFLSVFASPAEARLRALNFGFDTITSDQINASSHGGSCPLGDTDDGNMVYQAHIDQKMMDQVNAVADAGGVISIIFTLRTAFSFLGDGSGRIDATVTTSVGGTTVDTITISSDGPSGTTETRYVIALDASMFYVGGTVEVNASGVGQAYANTCGSIHQAISTFYFRTGGTPLLSTNPFL